MTWLEIAFIINTVIAVAAVAAIVLVQVAQLVA